MTRRVFALLGVLTIGCARQASHVASADAAANDGPDAASDAALDSTADSAAFTAPDTASDTTAPTTLVFALADDSAFSGMALVGQQDEAALLYVGPGNGLRVLLQRVDEALQRRGQTIEMGSPAGSPTALSLATDGRRYLGCWTHDEEISCSTATRDDVSAQPVHHVLGATPTLVRGQNSWVLGYIRPPQRRATKEVVLQKLSDDFQAQGVPQVVEGSKVGEEQSAGLLLASVGTGYVVVVGDPARVQRLDANLNPVGPATTLPKSYWFWASIAATDTAWAVSISKPYGSELFIGGIESDFSQYELSGGDKTGLPVALLPNGSVFAAAWLRSQDMYFHRAISMATPPPLDPFGSSPAVDVQMVRLGAGVLVASRTIRSIEMKMVRAF